MKQTIMTFSFFVSLTLTLLSGGCKDNAVDESKTDLTIWKEVEQFRGVDIRYMLVHNGTLYISAIKSQTNTFALMKTDDGERWDTLKIFERWIGPLTFHEDTLTVWENSRMWKYHPSIGWKVFWKPTLSAFLARDMVWLNNKLIAIDNAFAMTFSVDTVDEWSYFPNAPVVSKFIVGSDKVNEITYTRPFIAFDDAVYRFDGKSFSPMMNGIQEKENIHPNYPSICIFNDTLYAGFNTPSRIKRYVNQKWINFTDTIANTIHANIFRPPLKNRPSAITFNNSTMYVGTEWTGVLKWSGKEWEDFSSGLPLEFPDFPQYQLLTCVVQLHAFKKYLFAGYGEPWYAPVYGGRGLYRATIQ